MKPKSNVDREASGQDDLYREAADAFGSVLGRWVRPYERDPDKQKDLRQEIHLALWRSFLRYESRCSLRTWVYRVAHNTAVSYVLRQRRLRSEAVVDLGELEAAGSADQEAIRGDRLALDQLYGLIHRLNPPVRQLMLLYLEGLDAALIGDVTALSAGNVRTKIHRIKGILEARFHQKGGTDG